MDISPLGSVAPMCILYKSAELALLPLSLLSIWIQALHSIAPLIDSSQILEARAQTQQRRNPLTTQTSPNRRPHRPSRHGVPSLSLTDIELNTIPVIHITRPQMDTAHQDNRAETVGQEIKEEAVWEMGKAV